MGGWEVLTAGGGRDAVETAEVGVPKASDDVSFSFEVVHEAFVLVRVFRSLYYFFIIFWVEETVGGWVGGSVG